MSIAVSSLLIIAGLIPGIAFLNSYYTGKFPRQLTGMSPLSELALYFVWALPIDAIAVRVLHPQLDSALLDALGQALGLESSGHTIGWLYAELLGLGWWSWVLRYLALIACSVIAGSIARRVVWALRLDAYVPILRLKAEWFYALIGRTPETPRNVLPQADVLVSHPDGSRLYSGVVSGFEPSREGGIEELYLLAAQRHKKLPDGANTVVDIPGDVLAISGSSIHSINMRYFVIPEPDGRLARWWALALDTARAFWEGG